ncbi:MAG: dihydropteroate synthase [Mariprofundaceae bacterium]|nr:dihydropteroate synthase [Mariprofundaceae bacterium]
MPDALKSSWHRQLGQTPRIMGVLNCTPDSFSDGATHQNTSDAISHGIDLWHQGADIIDVGGESTRPGASPVPLHTERERVIPVVQGLLDAGCNVSVDTMKAALMQEVVTMGASMINDVSALCFDPESMSVLADCDADICLMHMQGSPQTMQHNLQYDADVMACVIRFFEQRLHACEQAGIARKRIILDPGIGFGKSLNDNLQLIARLNELCDYFSLPVLLGVSRKSFLGAITGKSVDEREWATAAAVAIACFVGADILRVHDVLHQREVAQIATPLRDIQRPSIRR